MQDACQEAYPDDHHDASSRPQHRENLTAKYIGGLIKTKILGLLIVRIRENIGALLKNLPEELLPMAGHG